MPRAPLTLADVQGEPSWCFASDCVEACLTRDGGHLAPVTFHTADGPVQPFAIASWAGEPMPAGAHRVLRMLRGDFFCAPFGGSSEPVGGKHHPLHGETATARWTHAALIKDADGVEFSARLSTRVSPGLVRKHIRLRSGETNLYCRHELHGFEGPLCLGHHATLQFPDKPGAGRISFSPLAHRQVTPGDAAGPLRAGATFSRLDRVPLADGGTTDLSRYPAREGTDAIAMVSARRDRDGLAWSAVTYPNRRYVWFSLKDPRVLASTVLWHCNGGVKSAPWRGLARNMLGLEDVTAHFALGLESSVASNAVSRRGIPTVLHLRPDRPVRVDYVMAVAAIPRGFDRVRGILFRRDHVVLRADSGRSVEHPVNLGFFTP